MPARKNILTFSAYYNIIITLIKGKRRAEIFLFTEVALIIMMKLKIYGSRGSAAFFSRSNIEYGGNTACSVLDIDGHTVMLDCGTGLMQFYYDMKDNEKFKSGFKFDVLLSHLHLDHITGFSTFTPILSPDSDIRIFAKPGNDDIPLASQVFGIFSPPYWPVDIANMNRAKLIKITGEEPFMLGGNIKVTPFLSGPGNETVNYRIDQTNTDKSVVYLLDYEITENSDKHDKLIDFCANADLVIFDAAYLREDYPSKRGWGHSTFDDGIGLAEASSCKKMIFSHICQDYSDKILNSVKSGLDGLKYSIAFDGMEAEV